MARRRRNNSATGGHRRAAWLRLVSWRAVRRPLYVLAACGAGIALVAAGSQALEHLDGRLERALLSRSPQATVEFVDLPDSLVALAGGDLRGGISDLLDKPWTHADRCREIAQRLATIGWIENVESVRRTHAGRFEIRARYRLPVALVALRDDDYALVDAKGVRLPGLYVYHPRWYTIDGVVAPLSKVGEPWGGPDLLAGLAILTSLQPEPFRHQIAGVNVANFQGRRNPRGTHLELMTDRPGGRIRWGSAPGFEVEENLAPQKWALLRQNFAQTGRADAGHPVIDVSTFPDRFHIPG